MEVTNDRPWRLADLSFRYIGKRTGKGHHKRCGGREGKREILDYYSQWPYLEQH
jgi:hypothetical protein